jgi:EAL domain-containing protein (putative c-di-GMP-specific phosphodiesterase class I)
MDDVLGEVTEARAVEAAETAGLIREVTWWVYNTALRMCAEFAQAGIELQVALKVTASGLAQPDFADFVDRALRTWNMPPERLTIEVHESALVAGIEQVKEMLARLKALGLRLGIDGFGNASSSLSNLAQLPLDEVKIGATYVGDMRRVTFNAKIVRSLAHLAQDLGLRVTADGIEDDDTALALSTIGCERIQGSYVGRPLTAQEVFACKFDGAGPVRLPFGPAD